MKREIKADGDTVPSLPIGVCISFEDNKPTTVRFSPEAAAKISRAKGFPHDHLSRAEKKDKLEKLLRYDHSRLIRRGIVRQATHFNKLASCYFPHMPDVRAGGKRTTRELFHSEKLPWAMGKHNKLRDRSQRELREESNLPNIFGQYSPPSVLTLSSRQKALRTFSGTQLVSNFSPVAAAALYDRLLPAQGGVTWDMSCGWGGRLLGAIACPKVHKYIGCDPCTETFKGLERMRGELVPLARAMGRDLEVELYKLGSETMRPKLKPGSVNLCFTSSPYFLQEKYSQEETQSWVKFPDPDSWLNGFMGATLDNCEYALAPDGLVAVNIADVKSYEKLTRRKLTDDFVALAEGKRWRLVETLQIALSAMPGAKHKYGKHKREPIFVFEKRS